MNLRRGDGRPLVVAHRGASAEAPENSREAFTAAIAAGADLVELDVTHGLVVAHDAGAPGLHLFQVLELLAPHPIGVHVDLKQPGDEGAVLDALDRFGLRERALLSTAFPRVARRLASLAPEVPRAIGYPRDRVGVARLHWPGLITRPGAAALRAAMPARLPLLLIRSRASVLALHHTLCSAASVSAAHRRGIPVFAWTANDPDLIRRLAALGVDAIVSDDPKTVLATLETP
ncbi:MAG TPA: glycerophosphodiester phosphodiesterase [Gaiellaceae bacterium]|nr:glycerophosphodiester phosphodiesterase [Gaiellaceae bacterium]